MQTCDCIYLFSWYFKILEMRWLNPSIVISSLSAMGNVQIMLLYFTRACSTCPKRKISATCHSVKGSQQSSPEFSPEQRNLEIKPMHLRQPYPFCASEMSPENALETNPAIEIASPGILAWEQSQGLPDDSDDSSWSIVSSLTDAHTLPCEQKTSPTTSFDQAQLNWIRVYVKVRLRINIRKRLAKQWFLFSQDTKRNKRAGLIDRGLNEKFSNLGRWLALHKL
jgi:hypothetical protein